MYYHPMISINISSYLPYLPVTLLLLFESFTIVLPPYYIFTLT